MFLHRRRFLVLCVSLGFISVVLLSFAVFVFSSSWLDHICSRASSHQPTSHHNTHNSVIIMAGLPPNAPKAPPKANDFLIGWTDDDVASVSCVIVPNECVLFDRLQAVFKTRDAITHATAQCDATKMKQLSVSYECFASTYPQPYHSCAFADPQASEQFFSQHVRTWLDVNTFVDLHHNKPFVHVYAKCRRRIPRAPRVSPSSGSRRGRGARHGDKGVKNMNCLNESSESDEDDEEKQATSAEQRKRDTIYMSIFYRRLCDPKHVKRK